MTLLTAVFWGNYCIIYPFQSNLNTEEKNSLGVSSNQGTSATGNKGSSRYCLF